MTNFRLRQEVHHVNGWDLFPGDFIPSQKGYKLKTLSTAITITPLCFQLFYSTSDEENYTKTLENLPLTCKQNINLCTEL